MRSLLYLFEPRLILKGTTLGRKRRKWLDNLNKDFSNVDNQTLQMMARDYGNEIPSIFLKSRNTTLLNFF